MFTKDRILFRRFYRTIGNFIRSSIKLSRFIIIIHCDTRVHVHERKTVFFDVRILLSIDLCNETE